MNISLISVLVLAVTMSVSLASRVLELSDRFLEIRKEGHWLIMFYAPWCAHCKRLEPVWAHVAQSLYHTNIRVGKVDCTKYTSVASTLAISGYPTIMFLKGDEKDFVFRGDRTKDEIIHFALRVHGPPVQQITRHESLDNLKGMKRIFFVYVGEFEGPLWENFYDVAERFQPFSYFYAAAHDLTKKHLKINELPAVFVYKEESHYLYDGDRDPILLNNSLTGALSFENVVDKFHDLYFIYGDTNHCQLFFNHDVLCLPGPFIMPYIMAWSFLENRPKIYTYAVICCTSQERLKIYQTGGKKLGVVGIPQVIYDYTIHSDTFCLISEHFLKYLLRIQKKST